MRFKIILFCLLTFSQLAHTQSVKMIFDTDMGPDYDDVGALAMVHAFYDQGKIELLGTLASTNYQNVGDVLSIINTYFGKKDIPIGVSRSYGVDMKDWQFWSDSLVYKYPHYISHDSYQDAVKLYRKLLANSEDQNVTIVTVGFLSNIAELMRSQSDEISSLTGDELMHKKVKSLVSMAGKFPKGREFNIEMDAESANYVNDNWKGKWILSGFEIGEKIHTGLPLVKKKEIKNSPIQDVYRMSIPMAEEDKHGRMSWDQTAVLVAALGGEPYYKLEKGSMILTPVGNNSWEKGEGNHFILIEEANPKVVEELINELMMHVPKTKQD